MSDHKSLGFVRQESARGKMSALEVNRRLLQSLPLFLGLLPLSFFFILTSSFAPSLFRWYVGAFANSSDSIHIPLLGLDIPLSLSGVIWIAIVATALRIAAWISFEISGMWSAQGIHSRMTRALGATRTTYFDENPSGRLINRLVRDYDEVRSTAIIFIGDALNASTEVLSVSILAILVSPWIAVGVVPLLIVFGFIQWFRAEMIDYARSLAAVATSRVLDRKTDLIEGREIFLLYGKTGRLLDRMARGYEQYICASVLGARLETWSSFWINISAETFAGSLLVAVVFAYSQGSISLTFAGVIISALFGIRGSLSWLDFASSLMSRSVPHVRRVFEIADLPTEESQERDVSIVPSSSSASLIQNNRLSQPLTDIQPGDIQFLNYTMSYRPDTPVILQDLSLTLPLGSKTALIGRTGSGKTSVIQALFRMVYVHSGDLQMNGCSVFDTEIHSLRRLFGVVPQFPYLFAGDLRSNLDRSHALSDDQLVEALKIVGLSHFRLNEVVHEAGMNFSMGEGQLLCLARVIAAHRPFILMDEPTSGLDPETDARIHRVLETGLTGKTVLTIAHRRESLGRYDRIVEMSAGKVIWQGSPKDLNERG